MAELRSTIQSVYNVTDGSSMVAYNLVVDHQVHTGALMSSDDQIVVQLNKTVGDVVEQLAFNSDTLTAAYATSGNTGLVWTISGTTAILKCASGAAWKNEDIIISATINNIVVDKERISYSSSTPILELSNDVGSLMYSADGTTKLKNDEVATTSATVYVNGNAVPTAQVQFNWNIIDGVGTSSANTITVSAININAFKAQAVCTATFNNISYQKVFKVMRNTQGIAGVDGKPGTDGKPGADANVIEVFDIYFYRTLQMAQENTPLPVVPDKTVTIPSNVPNNADTWTKALPNGEAGRLIYHSIVTDTKQGSTTTILTRSVSNPTLILAYDSANVQSPESYAQYLTLTNFDRNDALGWSDSGALYIKADYIQSKGILVKKGENILLAAGGDGDYKEAVQIAGFVVNDHAFYNTAKLGLSSATHMTKPNDTNFDRVPNTNYIYIGTDGIGLVHTGEASGDPPIEKQVYLMGGQIFANAGTIGGWTIKPDMLRYANQAGLLTGNAFYYDNEAGIQNDSDDVRPQGMIRFWSGLYGENTSESDKLVRGNKLHFCVTADGTLYADQAFISGTVNAGAGTIGGLKISTITPSTVMKSTTKTTTVNIIIPPQSQGTEESFPLHGYVFGYYKEFLASSLKLPEDATLGSITIVSPTYPDTLSFGATWADLTDFEPLGSDAGFTITASTFIKNESLTSNVQVSVNLQYTYYQSVIAGPTESAIIKISSIDGTFSVVTKDQKSILTSNISNIATLYSPTAYLDTLYNGDVVLKNGVLSYMGSNVYFDNSTKDFLYKAFIYSDFTYFMVYLNKPLLQDKTFQVQYTTTSNLAISTPVAVTIPAGQYSVIYQIPDDELSLATFTESKTQELTFTMATKQSYDLAYNGNGLVFDSIPLLPETSKKVVTELQLSNKPGYVGGRLGGELGNIIGYRWWYQAYIKTLYIYTIQSPDNGGLILGDWSFGNADNKTNKFDVWQAAAFHGSVWMLSAPSIGASSRLAKTNIQVLNKKHDALFDNLQPCQFEYINGTSHRLHYGMIVDEVGDALRKAGLTTQECAAYCLMDPSNPTGEGGLRYEEFIALNTWQIQLLKPRVSDLEQRCIILEARVKELEEKYENIQ